MTLTKMNRVRLGAAASMLALAGAAGCGEEKVEQAELERKVKQSITKEVGQAPKAINCPGDIEAKVDAKTRCTLVAPDDSEVDVAVRVREVEGDTTRFDIQVADKVRR